MTDTIDTTEDLSLEPAHLTQLSDKALFNSQVALQLACGRSHSALRKKTRQYFCFLFLVLKSEADRRGKPSPTGPYKA